MKWWVMLQIYSCALVFAIWAALWAFGVDNHTLATILLAVAAISFVVAERERARERRALHEEVERERRRHS